MATSLSAYDAAPLPPPSPAPLAVYLVTDGVPTEIVGIHDFDITVENPPARTPMPPSWTSRWTTTPPTPNTAP